MKNMIKLTLLAAAIGTAAVATATPSDAQWGPYHHRHHVRVYDGYSAYAYAPDGAYAYAPRYSWSAGDRNERDCMRSPGSIHYVPCINHQ